MSSEVCPYCGKTYKRLKSHLPHCKAAASSKPPRTQHGVTSEQIPSSDLAAASPKPTPKGKKSTQIPSATADLQRNKSKKVSAITSKQLQSSTSASIPPSTRKTKQKLADQINTPSSVSLSLPLSSPIATKPKNKSLRALIEAAKSKHVSKESLERSRAVSEEGSVGFLTDPVNTRTAARVESIITPHKDTKPKEAPKKSPKRTTPESPSTTQNASHSLDSDINETVARDDLREDRKGEFEDSSVNKLLMKSRSDRRGRITLQDVKATLRRARTTSQSSMTSVMSQIESADDLSGKSSLCTSLDEATVSAKRQTDIDCLVAAKALSHQLSSTGSQLKDLQSVKKKSLKSEQASLIPLQHDAACQPKLTSPATSLLSGHLSSQVSQSTPLSHTISMSEGLKVGHRMTGLLSKSPAPSQISNPHPFLLAPPVRVETRRPDEGLMKEKLQLNVGRQNTANSRAEDGLTQRHLGQVRLRELPEWLACNSPRTPRDLVDMVQRGWRWYHRRYIDVKKGGVGGLGMLLAGYCVLGYIWSYPHIKRDRWRKYH